MRRLAFALLLGPSCFLAATAHAQPGDPPTEPTGALDEAKIREIVDREIARVLNERAAKEAAERAAQEQAAAETGAAKDEPSDLKGASGFFDTRIAFTLTN